MSPQRDNIAFPLFELAQVPLGDFSLSADRSGHEHGNGHDKLHASDSDEHPTVADFVFWNALNERGQTLHCLISPPGKPSGVIGRPSESLINPHNETDLCRSSNGAAA